MGAAQDKQTLKNLIDEYPDAVIERFKLTRSGGLRFGGVPYWNSWPEYKNAYVTVVMKGGKVAEVFDEKGAHIAHISASVG